MKQTNKQQACWSGARAHTQTATHRQGRVSPLHLLRVLAALLALPTHEVRRHSDAQRKHDGRDDDARYHRGLLVLGGGRRGGRAAGVALDGPRVELPGRQGAGSTNKE